MPDSLVRVKSKTADSVYVEGYGVIYGGRDLYGETFTPGTRFDLDLGEVKPVYFDHSIGPNPEPMNERIGKTVKITSDDVGIWVEAVLDRRNEYFDGLQELLELNALGWSSGAPDHLVRVDSDHIIRAWPIAEFSLTPTPAEGRTFARAGTRKSIPVGVEGAEAVTGERQVPAVVSVVEHKDAEHMPEEIKQPEAPVVEDTAAMKALNEKIDKLATAVGVAMEQMEHSPKTRDAGYWSPVGGTADPHVKSFGDLLQCAVRRDTVRMEKVYGVKAMTEDSGVNGGFTVPETFETTIRVQAYTAEPWLGRLLRTRVTTPAGQWPAMDTYYTPTAGVGEVPAAAGVKSSKRAEGVSYTEQTPQMVMFNWRVHDVISGYTKASKELVSDSPQALESLLTTLFGVADAAKQAYYFLYGTGSGEPLGILNSTASLEQAAVTNNVFSVTDALGMIAKFLPVGGSGEFLMHRTNLPSVGKLESSAGGAAYMANANISPGSMPLYGFPITWTEHLPVTTTAKSILLIAPAAYQVWELGGMEIGFSEHASFLTGEVVWRFSHRLDGQPLFKNTVKQANPGTAHQVSPFVNFKFAT